MKKRYKTPLKLLKRLLAKRNRCNLTFGLRFRWWNSLTNLDQKTRLKTNLSTLLRFEENSDLFYHFFLQKTHQVQKPPHLSLFLNALILSDALLFMVS